MPALGETAGSLLLTLALTTALLAGAGRAAEPAPGLTAADQRRPPVESRGELVEVRVRSLNVRAEPTTDAPIVAWLREGRRLPVLERSSGWVRVEFDTGRAGWVYGSLVAPAGARGARAKPPAQRRESEPVSASASGVPGAPSPGSPGRGPAPGAPRAEPARPTNIALEPAPQRPLTAASPYGGQPYRAAPPAAGGAAAVRAEASVAEDGRLRQFKAEVERVNERVRRAVGVEVFAAVEELGGAVALTATEAWQAAPEAARRANLKTLAEFWGSFHGPGVVRVINHRGEVLMEESHGAVAVLPGAGG